MRGLIGSIVALLLLVSLGYPQVVRNAKLGGQTVVRRAQAGGSETDFVTDTFTEGSDTLLSSHTPELGSTWIDHPDGGYTDPISIIASTDRAWKSSGTGAGMFYNDTTPPSTDYCCECVMRFLSIGTGNAGIVWRADTSANTMMLFQTNNGTGWRLRKIVAGTQTTIGSEDTTTNIPTAGDARTMKACSSGNIHTAYIDGALLGTVGGSDSAVTAAGKTGIRFSGTFTSTTLYQIESFRCFTP